MRPVIKTIIVDDHQHAIAHLRQLLQYKNDICVLDEASNAAEAFDKIKQHAPDLIFLDVEMPEKSGFDLLTEMLNNQVQLPAIIFTTGHNAYAIKALRSGAVDYLLKPVSSDELDAAVRRFLSSRESTNNNALTHQIHEILQNINTNNRILIPTITGYKNVHTSDILYVRRDANASGRIYIHYNKKTNEPIPACFALKYVADLLPENRFFQTDRNIIINLDYLFEIETKSRECILVKNGERTTLPISRQRLRDFKIQFLKEQ